MGCTLRFWSAGHPLSAQCSDWRSGRAPKDRRPGAHAAGGLSDGPPRTLHYGVICSRTFPLPRSAKLALGQLCLKRVYAAATGQRATQIEYPQAAQALQMHQAGVADPGVV